MVEDLERLENLLIMRKDFMITKLYYNNIFFCIIFSYFKLLFINAIFHHNNLSISFLKDSTSVNRLYTDANRMYATSSSDFSLRMTTVPISELLTS